MAAGKVDEELMTAHELAALMAMNPRSLEQWRRKGYGPGFIRLSGRKGVRYPASEVCLWLEEHMKGLHQDGPFPDDVAFENRNLFKRRKDPLMERGK